MLNLNVYYTSSLRIGFRHIRTSYSPLKLSSSLLSSALFLLCCRGGMEKFWKVLPLGVKKPSHPHLRPSPIVPAPSLCRQRNVLPSQHTSLAELAGRSMLLSCRVSRWVEPLKKRPRFSFCLGQWQNSVELMAVRKNVLSFGSARMAHWLFFSCCIHC